MSQSYLGILFLLIVGVLNAVVMIGVSQLAGANRPTPVKASPYESGIVPIGDTRERFSVKFYIVAMLFIIFDVETVFFFPWAAVYKDVGMSAFVAMLIFIGVLVAGLAYEWKKGALEWD